METKEWQQFCKTGSVEDYLIYREAVANSVREERREVSGKEGEKAVGHAGFCNSDGNDFTGASHGRI